MAEFDDNDELNELPGGHEPSEAEKEALLEQMTARLPPELYSTLQPLLLLGGVANHMLLGYADDPIPAALKELLDYDNEVVQRVGAVDDTRGLGRLMALHTLEFFDFMLVSRLVFESSLDEPLRAFLARNKAGSTAEDHTALRDYLLKFSEDLLENLGQYLAAHNEEAREELRMRRLQTESIFATLGDTLRPFYPPGQSPEEEQILALDQADEAEDQQEVMVSVVFNEVQRLTLSTALQLPGILMTLGETPFAEALATVPRFRQKAMQRLANRLRSSPAETPFTLSWSELLRLYQAAQVCALSAVADVSATGSLEDVMLRGGVPADKDNAPAAPVIGAEQARETREMITTMMSGFIDVVENSYPHDQEVKEAKAEISKLAELLVE
ncbi:hypothetical protein GCM10023185_41050 [Hymenobacter saemangeumensis]|uniref:Uncharacterized protein n=1 Tax=Hymenobacter saemangeumensis TaxID=1084522 RepID=A0ABP8ISM8_9BACT